MRKPMRMFYAFFRLTFNQKCTYKGKFSRKITLTKFVPHPTQKH